MSGSGGATLLIPFPDEPANIQPAFVAAQPEPTADPEVRHVAKRRERQEELLNHGDGPLPINGDYFVECALRDRQSHQRIHDTA